MPWPSSCRRGRFGAGENRGNEPTTRATIDVDQQLRRPERRRIMTSLALYVQLEAKPGKERQVMQFLTEALPMVEAEKGTTAWFAMKMGPSTFGIFDAFSDETG